MSQASHTRADRDARVWALFIGLSVVWGSSFLFIKLGLEHGMSPLTLVTWRMATATVFLVVALRLGRGRIPRAPGALQRIAVLSVINVALPALLITWGERSISSALASVLNGLQPLFAIVIAAIVLHDEPMTVNRLVGLLVGFGGAVVLVSPYLGQGTPGVDPMDALLGELAVVLAALSYACGAVWARHTITGRPLVLDPETGPRPPSPVEIALPQVGFAAALTLVLSALTERPSGGMVPLPPDLVSWVSVTWLGMLGSGFAYLLFFGIMRAWGATRTTLVTYALPVVGITLGVIVLDEELHPAELLGTLLILAGLVVANARVGQRVLFGRRPSAVDEMQYHLDPP